MMMTSKGFPFLAFDAGLPKDAHQQTAADVVRVRIWDSELSSAPLHVLVIAARHGRLEAQRTEAGDQVLPLDGPGAGIQATARISMRLPSMSGIGE